MYIMYTGKHKTQLAGDDLYTFMFHKMHNIDHSALHYNDDKV